MNNSDNMQTNAGEAAVSATFALPYAQLCAIAYAPDHSSIASRVSQEGAITSWATGKWSCVWGPSANSNDANLVYVAKFVPEDAVSSPTFVVVIRGTDIIKHLDNLPGDDEQLKEDLDVENQVEAAFPGAPLGAKIASGTYLGLTVIQGLTDPAQPAGRTSLADFLIAEMQTYGTDLPRLVVTGHSLGGCLTTVVAPYLLEELAKHSLSPKILPYTFAGPSAGNREYADYFDQTFVPNYRYFNSMDIIPHWWASLEVLKTIYDDLPMPELVAIFFDVKQQEINDHGANYEQPSAGNSQLFGALLMNKSWTKEAAAQHHITNYVALLEQL